MYENDKKIATEEELYDLLNILQPYPSEYDPIKCLRKDRIDDFTEQNFPSLNEYIDEQLVPLDSFANVVRADYIMFSLEWDEEGGGDLDCIIKPVNFDTDFVGKGYGGSEHNSTRIGSYNGCFEDGTKRTDEILQWSGDSTSPGGEYFLIEVAKLKEYKEKYNLTNTYFDFNIYTQWYVGKKMVMQNLL